MKRSLPKVRPGSRAAGRLLVDQADYRDLLKRHEAVRSLVNRSLAEVAALESAKASAGPTLARKLDLELHAKRRFLTMLETRLEALAHDLAEFERQQLEALAPCCGSLGAKEPPSKS